MIDNPEKILSEVEHCLGDWQVEPHEIVVASLSENIVYRVTNAEGQQFALRIHRPFYHTLDELKSEHQWTDALAQAGFPVPTALPTVTGDYYVPVQVGGGQRYAGLVQWLDDAVSLYELEEQDLGLAEHCDLLNRLGKQMAKLHNHTETWQVPNTFTRHRLDIDGFFGEQPFWGRYWEAPQISNTDRPMLLATQANIVQELQQWGQKSNRFGMIHADLHNGNVMFRGPEQDMVIIDFDDAGFGWFLYDIAVALNEYQRRDDFLSLQEALLQGYQSIRPMSAQELELLPMFLHIRDRAIIGWAVARPELDNAERLSELVAYTCQQAEQYA